MQLVADCKTIVTDYRVYALFEPQIHLVIAGDRVAVLVPKLQSAATKIQTAINNSKASADIKAQATAKLDDITSKIAAAQQAIGGLPAQVLALTPSGYPGNESTLKAARASLQTAVADLEGLRGDLKAIIQLLKGGTGTTPSASPQATTGA